MFFPIVFSLSTENQSVGIEQCLDSDLPDVFFCFFLLLFICFFYEAAFCHLYTNDTLGLLYLAQMKCSWCKPMKQLDTPRKCCQHAAKLIQ